MLTKYLTYREGFRVKFLKDFTNKDVVDICEYVNMHLNLNCRPEPISEGGLILASLGYKSMRFAGGEHNSWAGIYPDTFKKWTDEDTVIVFGKKGSSMTTFLKAFDNATPWTINELSTFRDIFERLGFKITHFPAYLPKKEK